MNLELSPNEYMNTSREVIETAMAYQSARARGVEQARSDYQQEQEAQRERERQQRESEARLMQKLGG